MVSGDAAADARGEWPQEGAARRQHGRHKHLFLLDGIHGWTSRTCLAIFFLRVSDCDPQISFKASKCVRSVTALSAFQIILSQERIWIDSKLYQPTVAETGSTP